MKRRKLTEVEQHGGGLLAYVKRPIVLDFFCGAGGASYGYVKAGFRVIGFDLDPLMLKRYPWECYQVDAREVLDHLVCFGEWRGIRLENVVLIHASPPCEGYSKTARIGNADAAEMLIDYIRFDLLALGKPYVIENVPEAREHMVNPIMLCGAMFPPLRVYRHRLFEANFEILPLTHPPHTAHQPKMGRPVKEGDFIQVVGHFSNANYARRAMGICWMGRDQLKEAIPPAYTDYVGRKFASLHLNPATKELSPCTP